MTQIYIEDDTPRNILPPAALKAIGLLLFVVLILAVVARLTGAGSVLSTALHDGELVAERLLVFESARDSDPVRLLDGDTGELIQLLPPGEGGFLRGAVRPLNRERNRAGADPHAPYRLELRSTGALLLVDPLTDMVLDLHAFGPTNAGAFAALLPGRDSRAGNALNPGVSQR